MNRVNQFMSKPVNITTVTIIVFILLYSYTSPKKSINKFTHYLPKRKYIDIVNEFGKPCTIVNKPNGVAVWYNRDFFTKIMLKDESIKHLKPKLHCDFLYSTVNIHIPEHIITKVLKLSESIYYDRLKKELTVRCGSMGPNVATLYLALRIIDKPHKYYEAYKAYGATIELTKDSNKYNKLKDGLRAMVHENQKKYASKMPDRNCST